MISIQRFNIPITTIVGIQSLANLLTELPLPIPLPGATGCQNLLSHLADSGEARKLLNTKESALITLLIDALYCTTDQIEVKDEYYAGPYNGQIPQLAQCLLDRNPGIFKDSAYFPQSENNEQYISSDQLLQKQCTNIPVHPQQPTFSTAAISSCESYLNKDDNPSDFPFEFHATILQNKSSNVVLPKSLMEYSPYAHSIASSGQQHPASLHHNIIFQETSNSFVSSSQDNPPMLNSVLISQDIVNVSHSSSLCDSFSNMNCASYVDLNAKDAEQNNDIKNRFLISDKITSNVILNSSSIFSPLNNTNNIFFSSPTSPQHVNSLNAFDEPAVPYVNSTVKPILEEWQHVPNKYFNQSDYYGVGNTSNLTEMSERTDSQVLPLSASEVHNKSQTSKQVESKVTNENPSVCIATSQQQWKSLKPIVLLSKLSMEDQLLAQKSIKMFMLKNKCMGVAEEKRKYLTDPIVSISNLSTEELLVAEKSIRKSTTKSKKVTSSPEVVKLPIHHKISEVKNCQMSPLGKESHIDNKLLPCKQGRNHAHNHIINNSMLIKNKGIKRSINVMKDKVNTDSSLLSERAKRKRYISEQTTCFEPLGSEDKNDDKTCKEISSSETLASLTPKVKKLKKRKAEKEAIIKSIAYESVMNTNAYQQFSSIVNVIFDSVKDIYFCGVIDEDAECPAEALIPLDQLEYLSREAAKLKHLHAMSQFPPECLVRLLALLERNIVDGAKLHIVQLMEEQDEEETNLCLELNMERLMRSADASLAALYIMTSPKMPEKIFLENVIERIVFFFKYQLQNTIFPLFDPAYKSNPKSKDGYVRNIKQNKARSHKIKGKFTLQLYNKFREAVSLLAELLELQTLADTIILQVSVLGVSPFFVEGINELQLNALRLITIVFAHYDEHRQSILEDILSSIAKLPTSKRSLRNYRLNSEENIQMLTALVLQLIHSVIRLPESDSKLEYSTNRNRIKGPDTKVKFYMDKDVLIITSYEASMKTAINFLSFFLRKCGAKNEEMDYRPLFDNFLQDLLITVNKPEWPASELLLSILGRILIRNFSNKSIEMTLRVASLDYLGIIAARLCKNAIISQEHEDMINDVIQRITAKTNDSELSSLKEKMKNKRKPIKCDEVKVLQKALLSYLGSNRKSDPAYQFCQRFYIAQWYKDAAAEIQHSGKSLNFPKEETEKPDQTVHNKNKSNRSRINHNRSRMTYKNEETNKDEESSLENDEVIAKIIALANERKRLLALIKNQEVHKIKLKEEEHIDYETAELISKFLASTRHFSKSFDLYLLQILRGLSETAVAIRIKAMKCLTLVVEVDPSILSRSDMQKAVHGRLLDNSTSVREAAIDLLGKFILIYPELISQYYEMLTARILDIGISVRKRVIKILRDICVEQPNFSKTPEICAKIIRCVNDEDGIKKLVGEIFQNMWFVPISEKKSEKICQKVKNIIHVVEACSDTGLEWFEQLLTNLLKNKDSNNYKSVMKSCKQIVDCLVENLLQLEESSENVDGRATPHLVACLTTLYLFCKIYPPFVVPHATTIQPYLSMKCNIHSDFLLLRNVAQILELVIPLMEHPSESFLAQIEEEMVKLIFCQHMSLLKSCVSCLGVVVNRVTRNYQLVKDCFKKFFIILLGCKKEYQKNAENRILKLLRPKLLRSLYTIGLFCCHFDIDVMDEPNKQIFLKDHVLECIVYFSHHDDEDICLKALTGLGFIMIRYYEFMLEIEVKTLYHNLLTSPVASAVLKCQVLKNITNYLMEEEMRMVQKDAEWNKISKREDLKEMSDIESGMASTVIQIYLKQILECVLHTELLVRKSSLQVIHLILKQGLVHPVQIITHLICLGSDDSPVIRNTSNQLLQEIEKKYPGFIQMKAVLGVRMSFKMQQLIQSQNRILRGFHELDTPVSRNGFLYSVMRSNRQSRRAFLLSLLKLFDEQAKTPLTELLYIADNIAYFPYMAQDEPLFIMHHVDIMLSISGSNLLETFQEALLSRQMFLNAEQNPANPVMDDYNESDDFNTTLEHLPEDTSILKECISASQGCILLLYLKRTLKEIYGFTDNKIQQYSPTEASKVYERSLNRKMHVQFNPKTVIDFIKIEDLGGKLEDESKQELIQQYIHFKQLMLTIDPSNDDENNQVDVSNIVEKTSVNESSNSENNPDQLPLKKPTISEKNKFSSYSSNRRKSFKAQKKGKKIRKESG